MKLSQTALIHFLSKSLGILVGFLGMIYFARKLGAEVLGVYFLVLSVIEVLRKFGSIGVRTAVTKKLSEAQDHRYITAGLLVQAGIFILFTSGILIFQGEVNQYVGEQVAVLLIVLLSVRFLSTILYGVLDGEKAVHTSSALESSESVLRTLVQAVGVFLSFGLSALIFGYGFALIVFTALSSHFISSRIEMPTWEHFSDIVSYVKYSWLGGARNVSFAWMDTLVLGMFVSSTLIGIYEIAWMATTLLSTLSTSISRAIFPEVSNASINNTEYDISELVSSSVGYAGLLLVPGIVGSVLIGDTLLLIYGEEFARGYVALILLAVARLFYAYQQQFISTLNAINRPDLSFRVSAVFSAVNIILNFILIYFIGWLGAAIATATSAGIGLIISFAYTSALVNFRIPVELLGHQSIAVIIMGSVVFVGTIVASETLLTAILLVLVGAIVYFSVLVLISKSFRSVITESVPERVKESSS